MGKNKEIPINYVNHDDDMAYTLKELQGKIRTFDTGATRDSDEDKPDFTGILSPEVLLRFGQYMKEHSIQKDGTRRAYDNWKRGIPRDAYIQSLFRHFIDLWQMHELDKEYGDQADDKDAKIIEDALCAILFNCQGYLHEYIKGR